MGLSHQPGRLPDVTRTERERERRERCSSKTWVLEQDCHLFMVILVGWLVLGFYCSVLNQAHPMKVRTRYRVRVRLTAVGLRGLVNQAGMFLSTITDKEKLEKRRANSVVVS